MSRKNPVVVPEPAYRGILAVRDTGLTNMFDLPVVQQIARHLGFPETADWIECNSTLYATGIIMGFVSEGGEG